MFRRKSVKVDREQCASNREQLSATDCDSNTENNASATKPNNLITSLTVTSSNTKSLNAPATSLSSFKPAAIKNGTNGFCSPMVPVAPKLDISKGTKRKSIFTENLDDLSDIDLSFQSRPYASFSKLPTTFDGSNYSIDFSVEPNSPTVRIATEFDPFEDKILTVVGKSKLTNEKSLEKEVLKAPSSIKHENYDDLFNDSFEDLIGNNAEIPVDENSPESIPKNEGFRTAAGAIINISDDQRQQAIRRFQDLADLSKEVAGFIWTHKRQKMLERS